MSTSPWFQTESAFQQAVRELAALCGWTLQYHTHDSRRSDVGWPDLVLARPPELLIVELKSDRGRLSRPQRRWLQALEDCGVEVDVWRPRDWPAVKKRLTAPSVSGLIQPFCRLERHRQCRFPHRCACSCHNPEEAR